MVDQITLDEKRIREHILSFDEKRISPYTNSALEALERLVSAARSAANVDHQ